MALGLTQYPLVFQPATFGGKNGRCPMPSIATRGRVRTPDAGRDHHRHHYSIGLRTSPVRVADE